MTPSDSLTLDYELVSPLEEFENRIISMQQNIYSWWVENSAMLIIFIVLLAIIFACLIIIVVIVTDQPISRKDNERSRTEQYWRNKHKSKLLPRGYFSTMRRAATTCDNSGNESE